MTPADTIRRVVTQNSVGNARTYALAALDALEAELEKAKSERFSWVDPDEHEALKAELAKAWFRCVRCQGVGRVETELSGRPESRGMARCYVCKGDGYVRAALAEPTGEPE